MLIQEHYNFSGTKSSVIVLKKLVNEQRLLNDVDQVEARAVEWISETPCISPIRAPRNHILQFLWLWDATDIVDEVDLTWRGVTVVAGFVPPHKGPKLERQEVKLAG
ncbi:hypothetical protein PQX77_014957 [Marasmius sp. AFHP31]|nr:hypothetical protein PQX77_014957 [Marasmius sp. AFHP31]